MKKILQGFKKIFRRAPKYSERTYVCDPSRNTTCSKEGCWYIVQGPCRCTLKKKYAKRDSYGKPMKATEDEICNLEWIERQISFQRQCIESQER